MPKLGDIVLNTVYSENKSKSVGSTDHPIEGGLKIVDHVEKEPVKLSLTGICVGSDAASRLSKLEKYSDEGKRLTYVGRTKLTNVLIESIDTTKDVSVGGTAYTFSISLKQVTIANKKTYKQPKAKPKVNKGKQQPKKVAAKRTYTVVRGDNLWKISQKYYGSKKGHLYNLIYNANKKVIGSNPNLIFPGQKLIIP